MNKEIQKILDREIAALGVEKQVRETINSSTFRYKQKIDDVNDDIIAEIGDIAKEDFRPHLKLEKWDGECFLNIKTKENLGKILVIEDEKVKWIDNKKEYHFYPREPEAVGFEKWYEPFVKNRAGGFEIEIILNEKPETNVLEFDIETKGLKFLYQDILTPDERDLMEIEGEIIRPDFIEGSYAIYREEDKKVYSNKEDAKKYKTGKFGHIYRPKATDAEGNWVWEELNIDKKKGKLTITIPQEFLDNAVYPIKSQGTNFGYETCGSSSQNCGSFTFAGSFFTCSGTGNADSITACLNGGSADIKYQYAIYKKSDSSKVGVTNEGTLTGSVSDEKKVLTFASPPALTGQDYVLVAWNDYTGSIGQLYIRYDTESDKGRSDGDYTYNNWPDTASFDITNSKCSIYATYTAGGGTVAPTVTTQSATNVEKTTCTGNGNITDTGGENATRRGFCYMTGTSGDPTTANSVAYDDGDFTTGAFSKGITGLTAGTNYRVRAYAVNSEGTGYGNTVQVTTIFEKSISETGSGSESLSITNTLDLSENSQGSESLGTSNSFNISEIGIGSELLSLLNTLALSETGAGSDIVNLLNSFIISETMAGNETLNLLNSFILSDTVNSNEVINLLNNVDLQDSANGDEVISTIKNAIIRIIETAQGDEIINLSNQFSLQDTGNSDETIALLNNLKLEDTGNSGEIINLLNSLKLFDNGNSDETLNIISNLSIIEVATASEIISLLNRFKLDENGSGIESLSILNNLKLSDNVNGNELLNILGRIALKETGTGAENISIEILRLILKLKALITLSKLKANINRNQIKANISKEKIKAKIIVQKYG